MNFFRSDDHQVTLSQCWSLPCFTPFSGSKEATAPSATEPVNTPLSAPTDARFAPEAKPTADTTVALEA
jgi:hypothetical protein